MTNTNIVTCTARADGLHNIYLNDRKIGVAGHAITDFCEKAGRYVVVEWTPARDVSLAEDLQADHAADALLSLYGQAERGDVITREGRAYAEAWELDHA